MSARGTIASARVNFFSGASHFPARPRKKMESRASPLIQFEKKARGLDGWCADIRQEKQREIA